MIMFPKDPQGGGTWMAVSEHGQTICLLNGAFEKHISEPPYRKSRGLVAVDALQFNTLDSFGKEYDLNGIEPFTIVGINNMNLQEIRWDGKHSHIKNFDPDLPHIWSSITLYAPEVIEKRKQWFKNWIKEQKEFNVDSIRSFHHLGGEGDNNAILINRDNAMLTVSITTVFKEADRVSMIYEDLSIKKIYRTSFKEKV